MRVAVIGAGISGLTVAYRLRRSHEVTLFERAGRAGGHANTVCVERPGHSPLAVDTGFIVYNETTYPGFCSLLRELQVPTQRSDMSFGSTCVRCGISFSSRGVAGLFAAPRNLTNRAQRLLVGELSQFYRDARRVLALKQPPALTLGEYVQRLGPRRAVAGHYLLPMAAAIWSSPPDRVGELPFGQFVRFLDNHGLIGWQPRLHWRTVTGGSREYVLRLTAALGDRCLRTSIPVDAVRRDEHGTTVRADGCEHHYDAVVLACHADEAERLLIDASPAEHQALGGFPYSSNRVVLHTDSSVLPRYPAARASWNVRTLDCARPSPALTMTYDMNRLQSLPDGTRYLVSVNPGGLDPRRVLSEHIYTHPQYTTRTAAAQAAVQALQGQRFTYFAGAHLGHGFHEDGYQSGVRVAEAVERAA